MHRRISWNADASEMDSKMAWEMLRDIGLLVFAVGGTCFAIGKVLRRQLGSATAPFLATLGDLTMLAGACLAVAAMILGYFPSDVGLAR
jgi:hypothetical protein